MQNVEDRNKVSSFPIYSPDFSSHRGKMATIEVVKSPDALDWWPSSTEFGDIISIPQTIAGEITRVVIRYGSNDLTVPANVPLGSSVELHAFGKLSSSSPATRCGMNCIVKRPDGTTLSGSYNMSSKQNPGQELRFAILNISVNQAGVWQAIIQYYTI